MKRGRSTGNPTKAQRARFDALHEIGCIVAVMRGMKRVPCEIHHLTIGGRHGQKRRGHEFTIGLNPWSHRGETFSGLNEAQCDTLFGPSYARQPRLFRQVIGQDDFLLGYQDELILQLHEQRIRDQGGILQQLRCAAEELAA